MLETIFKNPSQQISSKYKSQIDQINSLENNFKLLSDSDLPEKTKELKQRLLKGEAKSSLIPEAFALVRVDEFLDFDILMFS